MGLEDANLVKYGGKAASSIPCSICLEDVTDYGDRASAKLHCGHQFHLDCIGSAFNAKGVMQCPNCRKIEKGEWRYADGGRPYPELNIDDLVNDEEDVYDLSYSDSSTYDSSFAQLAAAAFDEVEYPTTAYHDAVGQQQQQQQHGVVSEHETTISSYIAYIQPLHHHPSTSAANVAAAQGPRIYNNNYNNSNNQWNSSSQSASSEIPNSYGLHYNTNTTLFPPINHHLYMPPRTNADVSRSGPYAHSLFATQSLCSSGSRPPSSSVNRPYAGGSGAGARGPYFQQQPIPAPAPAPSDGTRGYYVPRSFQQSESSMLNPSHHIWERDPQPHQHPPVPFHQAGIGGGFRQRERIPPQPPYWL